ncbi:MAG: DUF2300 domain-containing protein [Candidatus Accumulibacter sp.]|nr:DUF2300 domain-containing protein [Accumulibacter sp.]
MNVKIMRVRLRLFLLLLLAVTPLLAWAVLSPPAPFVKSTPRAALEILWRDRDDPTLLVWRSFDTAGKPLDATLFHDPPVSPPGSEEPPAFSKRVPLGSLWKLFVHLWLVEERHAAPDYLCTGAPGASAAARKLREEELYCCDPGQGIDRDTALLRSCSPFFVPARLGIDPAAWRKFWEARPGARDAPWLADLGAMKPDTQVSPASILHALEAAPVRAREQTAKVLLSRVFMPAPGAALDTTALVRHLGGQLRIKTFSWHLANAVHTPYGGGAGWLTDGTAVWFAGEGTGQRVMARFGATLGAALSEALPPLGATLTPGCVRVNFFARYPFTVERRGGKRAPAEKSKKAEAGELRGQYVARFDHGKVSIPFAANGELTLTLENNTPRIEGRFGIDDYVARVLDREADARETEAARALSVVIRSYLLNEAAPQGNCLHIEDSSRAQRVSVNPPSAAARAVAGFTSGLMLSGAPVGYHANAAAKNRMAWADAVAASRAGQPWDRILRQAFPQADLAAMHDPAGVPCKRFGAAESWLAARAPRWQRLLQRELQGFEIPAAPHICLLPRGTPFSEQDRGRIHLRALRTRDDRITLAHEYLHLGLRHHPSGHDDDLIEHWARRLIDGENS